MFKHLTDFGYKRNWKEAIGFYLAYLLLGIILGAIVGALSSIFLRATTFEEGFNSGISTGAIASVIYCLVIVILVLVQKKLYKSFGYIILALLGVILVIAGGALLGLIIPAVMTTKESSSVSS